jgi:hypothetical protein
LDTSASTGQRLALLQQLLVLLQLLLGLLQVGLNLEQVLLLGDGLVEVGDGFVEARRVGVQRDLQTVFQLGRDLVDLVFGLGEGLLDLVARESMPTVRHVWCALASASRVLLRISSDSRMRWMA